MGQTKDYLWELYLQSLEDVRTELGTKGAFVILALKICLAAIGIGLLVGLKIIPNHDPIYNIVLGIFASDIVGFIVLWLITPFIAIGRMPKVAANKNSKQKDTIKKLNKDIDKFEDRFSAKKFRFIDPGSKLVINDIDVELRPIINNDSNYPITDYFALIEEVKYTKNTDEIPKETGLHKNSFHLTWPGEPPIAYRTGPIPPHDNAEFALVTTIRNQNAFKFVIRESDGLNKFSEVGVYIATIKIGGTFNGVGVSKRIAIAIRYDGEKGLDVLSYKNLPEE